jgi:hypothetical protein
MLAAAWQFAPAAHAQQALTPAAPAAAPAAPAPGAPAAPAAPAAPTSNAMTTPSMTGPLVANPNPISAPGPTGKVYFNGAISGMGLFQTSPVVGDHSQDFDVGTALLSLQTTDGPLQFFVQAGFYTFPALGAPLLHVDRTVGNFFGEVPVAYAKLVPNDTFSLQAGKLPTLIGAEYAFTFQNMNIERGLLWGQEPIVSRGVQGNYTAGPVALSLSLNDGFYSDNYDWLTGAATWTIDKINTLEVVAGGNFGHASKNFVTTTPPFVAITPEAQNNSAIFNLIYSYNNAPWTITPYFQYTNVPSGWTPGAPGASTYGGAVLASYSINDNWSLAGRFEAIGSSGGTSLLYGPGSGAVSFTITPTWQNGVWYARADGSYVQAFSSTSGFAFGSSGSTTSQFRLVLEGGIVF